MKKSRTDLQLNQKNLEFGFLDVQSVRQTHFDIMKPDKVIFIDKELEDSFNQLAESDPIKRSIKRAIQFIQEDFRCGRNVKKELIPKNLIKRYEINNLWIYDLSNGWRLLYSITSDKIEIIATILEWLNHKDYNRLFGFN